MNNKKEELTPKDYDRWGRTCVKFHDNPNSLNSESKKQSDEDIDALFEKMSPEQAREVANQNSPGTRSKRKKTIRYSEPADYFPKELREKYKLGEYAETEICKNKESE